MFDHFFYTFYEFYERREKGSDTIWTASLYVCVIQFLMLISTLIMIDIFTEDNNFIHNILFYNRIIGDALIIGFCVIVYVINLRRYRKKVGDIVKKYNKYPKRNWLKVWMLAVLMILLFLSPILWNELHKLFAG